MPFLKLKLDITQNTKELILFLSKENYKYIWWSSKILNRHNESRKCDLCYLTIIVKFRIKNYYLFWFY